MKGKTLVSVMLLAFVAVSVGYLIVSELRPTSGAADAPPAGAPAAGVPVAAEVAPATQPADDSATATSAHKVVAYYFHNTRRCMTCNKIERLAQAALRENFAAPLASGEIEWRAVNMEAPPNEHFVQDYGLVTSSLVLVDFHDGEQRDWTNLEKVWQYVHDDEAAFKQYVAEQTRAYLEHQQ